MKSTPAQRFALFLPILLAALTACSRDEPEEALVAEPDVAAEVPAVVVMQGDELVPWLESEGWWGAIDPENKPLTPRLLITRIRPAWSERANELPVDVKKALFYRLMLPLVMHANEMALNFRDGLETAQSEWQADGKISGQSLALLKRLAPLLPGMTPEQAQALIRTAFSTSVREALPPSVH